MTSSENASIKHGKIEHKPRIDNYQVPLLFRSPVLHVAVVLVSAMAIAAVSGLALWLTLGTPKLAPSEQGPLTPPDVYDGIKIALTVVGGIGGVVALVVAYRRQHYAEREHALQELGETRAMETAARDDTRLYTDRFRAAAEQLGSERSAIRLAGVYAMASLADDWLLGRQTCIDVLCAYLRMPYFPPSEIASKQDEANADWRLRHEERQVRHTVLRVIGSHLRYDGAGSWQGYDFDFTGVTFDGGDLSKAVFSGTTTFSKAKFVAGETDFGGCRFSGAKTIFSGVSILEGRVSFRRAEFSSGRIDFGRAKFRGGIADFSSAAFSGSEVYFGHSDFSGGEVRFIDAGFIDGVVDFSGSVFSGSNVNFKRANFTGSSVYFGQSVQKAGRISFRGGRFLAGRVYFDGSASPGVVSFDDSQTMPAVVSFGQIATSSDAGKIRLSEIFALRESHNATG